MGTHAKECKASFTVLVDRDLLGLVKRALRFRKERLSSGEEGMFLLVYGQNIL